MTYQKIRACAPVFLFCLLLCIYLMDMRTLHGAVVSIFICLVYAILPSEHARFITRLGKRKAPGMGQIRQRLKLIGAYGFLISLPLSLLAHYISYVVGVYKRMHVLDFTFIESIQLMCTFLIVCAYEGVYYMESWKRLFTESERLKQINLNSQYDFLRDQIKPHFLFNSLNTLSSIIADDPVRAERYVEEMSSVYRYLLKKNEHDLTTLGEELAFLDSYTGMLKTRFGEALIIDICIDDSYRGYLLPPLVLQLLMENAVKHNVVSKDRPLTVGVRVDGTGSLRFSNNLQKKRRREISAKTGLANLVARYEVLNLAGHLEIREDEDAFTVIVPLAPENVYAAVAE